MGECVKPRWNGPRCYRHAHEYSQLSWHLQVIATFGLEAEGFYPCDVVDFLEKCELVRASLCMTVLSAMIKEPSAVSLLLDSTED